VPASKNNMPGLDAGTRGGPEAAQIGALRARPGGLFPSEIEKPGTPSQTVGPFFTVGLAGSGEPEEGPDLVWLRGRVLDGAGDPVPDALVETWQADPPAFARCPTDAAGRWAVRTRRPHPAGLVDAPHVDLSIFARGLLNRVVTRLYLPEEEEANAADPVLAAVDPSRLATLVAVAGDDGYTFDIRLQGPHETVFFSF
jgi:protocatechuate 3,4-dioxygenase alpha subunit